MGEGLPIPQPDIPQQSEIDQLRQIGHNKRLNAGIVTAIDAILIPVFINYLPQLLKFNASTDLNPARNYIITNVLLVATIGFSTYLAVDFWGSSQEHFNRADSLEQTRYLANLMLNNRP